MQPSSCVSAQKKKETGEAHKPRRARGFMHYSANKRGYDMISEHRASQHEPTQFYSDQVSKAYLCPTIKKKKKKGSKQWTWQVRAGWRVYNSPPCNALFNSSSEISWTFTVFRGGVGVCFHIPLTCIDLGTAVGSVAGESPRSTRIRVMPAH